jgi:hypothetical protein
MTVPEREMLTKRLVEVKNKEHQEAEKAAASARSKR